MSDTFEKIEEIYAEKYKCKTTTRKSIGDFFIRPNYPVNVKSNNLNKKNYSPNIISASKVEKWLSENNRLGFIFVDYVIKNNKLEIKHDTDIIPIEHISWECLTIQAQGKGVIQKYKPLIIKQSSVKDWLDDLSKAYLLFVQKERLKLDSLEKKFTSFNPSY